MPNIIFSKGGVILPPKYFRPTWFLICDQHSLLGLCMQDTSLCVQQLRFVPPCLTVGLGQGVVEIGMVGLSPPNKLKHTCSIVLPLLAPALMLQCEFHLC